MSLYCRLINVKKGRKDEYIRLHQTPRQEVREIMIKHGMSNHAIFSKGDLLISVFNYTGDDYSADMKAIGDHPATKAWWKIIAPLQEPFKDRKEDEWWTLAEPVAGFGWELNETGGKK